MKSHWVADAGVAMISCGLNIPMSLFFLQTALTNTKIQTAQTIDPAIIKASLFERNVSDAVKSKSFDLPDATPQL